MRSTLHIKFIALYIIFGFLCLFSTATLTEQLVTDKLTEDTSHTLYREATFVANDYLPSYFSGDSSIYNVQSQLSAMRLYFNASIWFVDSQTQLYRAKNMLKKNVGRKGAIKCISIVMT